MSHECPECLQMCYCDGDDTGGLPDDDCIHACALEPDDDYDEWVLTREYYEGADDHR